MYYHVYLMRVSVSVEIYNGNNSWPRAYPLIGERSPIAVIDLGIVV